ncbi:protein of unknown function [Streptomyces sp. KY75]|nr:protein of unknown function [Streptomyces sp. KY70]CAD5993144.1 protein of unknown function [Streptomyces sp. KY75]
MPLKPLQGDAGGRGASMRVMNNFADRSHFNWSAVGVLRTERPCPFRERERDTQKVRPYR